MKLSIPLMNAMSTPETRPAYLDLLTKAGAQRVFVCPDNPFGDPDRLSAITALLHDNIAFYSAHGLEVGVWIGGLGHGGMLAHETTARAGHYTRIRGLGNGGEADDSFCPLDPDFTHMYREYVHALAVAGAKLIQIDDDLRLAMHGPVAIGCACPRHIDALNQRAKAAGLPKSDYTRESLAVELFTGAPTPIRKLWLELQGDTLLDFAAALREELDAVDPTIRLGQCACLSTWDNDGVDAITLSRKLAGSTKPFLRLIGAPYWTDNRSFGTTGLGSIVDLERMQFAWCAEFAPDIELMSEGDFYPRPRYRVPFSYGEAFHEALIANGTGDILKYMLDYTLDPAYETGYIRHHCQRQARRDAIAAAFADTEPAGIYIYEAMRTLVDRDCTGWDEATLAYRLVSQAANFTGAMSLPISFERSRFTKVAMVVGENAKTVSEEVVGMPLMVDAVAAAILMARGLDVGLTSITPMDRPHAETFPAGCVNPHETTLPVDTNGRFYQIVPKEDGVVASRFDNGAPAVVRYERENGSVIVVYAFDIGSIDHRSSFAKNYCRAEQLTSLLPPLPVWVQREPSAYVLARATEEKLVIGIWSMGNDNVYPEAIEVWGEYGKLTPIDGTAAELAENRVKLGDMIPPYGFGGVILEK